MGLQQQSLLPRKCSFTLPWLSEEEMGCWMENSVQEKYTHEACSSAGPAVCWVPEKLGATLLGFFHFSESIVNFSWPTISSWPLCSLDSHSRYMPPFLKNSPFLQQLSKDLWDIFILFCFSVQSHFFSNCVILNANIFIGQVTSGVELLEMREITSCSVCSVSMAARREVLY